MPPEDTLPPALSIPLRAMAFSVMCKLFDSPYYIRNINQLESRLLDIMLEEAPHQVTHLFQYHTPHILSFDYSFYIEEACDYILSEWITTTQFNTLQIIGDITV